MKSKNLQIEIKRAEFEDLIELKKESFKLRKLISIIS
jgi:hypothetical protein